MQYTAAFVMGAVALISFTGWIIGNFGLAGRTARYDAMVPVVSLVFLGLCAVLIVRLRMARPRARVFVLGVVVATISVALVELIDFITGLHVSPDRLFGTAAEMSTGRQVARMSPLVAVLFIVLAISLALYESDGPRRRSMAATLSMVVAGLGFTLCVGYAYDAPLLQEFSPFTPAFYTSLGMLLIGLGVAALGLDRWPFALFLGDSVRAQLMRAVLPAVVFTAVAFGSLGVIDIRFGLAHGPIPTSLVLIIVLATVTTSVLRSASRIGRRFDRAEAELSLYRKKLETLVAERTAELVSANAGLQEATAAKSDFLASMSHELRTPLNSIIGFSDMLQRGMVGDLSEEQTKQIGMIHRSGRQLLVLINDVLDVAKIEAGKAEVHVERLNALELVREAVELIRPMADDKGLEVRVDAGGSNDDWELCSDRDKVRQILLNLIGNAVKFTHDGTIDIVLNRGSDATLVIAVLDTGYGIAKEDLSRVFEAFTQIDTPDVIKPHGTGLGLSISREFAHLLGGEITVTSEVGVGSTFTLALPVQPLGSVEGEDVCRGDLGVDLA